MNNCIIEYRNISIQFNKFINSNKEQLQQKIQIGNNSTDVILEALKKAMSSKDVNPNNGTPTDDCLKQAIERLISKLKIQDNIDDAHIDTIVESYKQVEAPKVTEPKVEGVNNVDLADEQDTLQDNISLKLKKQFVNLYGGDDYIAKTVQLHFSQKLVSILFYDLTKPRYNKEGKLIGYGHIVTNTSQQQFNYNVYSVQSEMFKTLVDFIQTLGLGSDELRTKLQSNPRLYDISGNLNPSEIEVFEVLFQYIDRNQKSNTHISTLEEGFKIEQSLGTLTKNVNTDSPAYKYYKMVEAWIQLKYFDDLLSDKLGNIHVADFMKNVFPGTIKQVKYYPALDKSGRYVGFSMDDTRNGFSEAGKLSRTIMETLPVVKYDGTGLTGRFLTLTKVCEAIDKIKRYAIEGADTKIISQYALDIVRAPRANIYKLLEYIFVKNPNVIKTIRSSKKLDFTEDHINALYSLWVNVYNPKPTNQATLLQLENNILYASSINQTGYSYVDCISGLILRVLTQSYFNVSYDDNGQKAEVRKNYVFSQDIVRARNLVNLKLRKSSYETLESLRKAYKYTSTDGKNVKIILNKDVSLEIVGNGDWFLDGTRNTVKITVNGTTYDDIDDWLLKSGISFLNIDFNSIKKSEQQEQLEAVLHFISDTLGLDLLSSQGAAVLQLNSSSQRLNDLVDGATRYLIANDVLYQYNTDNKDKDLKTYLITYHKDFYGMLETASMKVQNNYLTLYGENNYILKAQHNAVRWLDSHVSAERQLLSGDDKMTIQNFSRKQEQAGRTSYLGAELQHKIRYISQYQENLNKHPRLQKIDEDLSQEGLNIEDYVLNTLGLSYYDPDETNEEIKERYIKEKMYRVAATNSLFVKDNSMLNGVIVQTDLKSQFGKIGQVKNMNDSELLINAIFQQFWGGFYSDDDKLKRKFIIQPTTFSDKTFILDYIIDNKELRIKDQEGRDIKVELKNVNSQQLIQIMHSTIGQYYEDLTHNILLDWNKIFKQLGLIEQDLTSLYQVDQVFQSSNYNIFEYIKTAQSLGIELIDQLHYVKKGSGLATNELLGYYQSTFGNEANLTKFLDQARIDFANSLLDNNILVSADSPLCANYVSNLYDSKTEWVDAQSGYLIIGKIYDQAGKLVDVVLKQDKIRLKQGERLVLNPIYDTYFNVWNISASNLRLLATGTELVHPYTKNPNKSISLDPSKNLGLIRATNILKGDSSYRFYSWNEFRETLDQVEDTFAKSLGPDSTEEELSFIEELKYCEEIYEKAMMSALGIEGCQGASLKRNVILPGTLQLIQQQTVTGAPSTVKIAAMQDKQAHVSQFNGVKKQIDANDGSADKSPLQNILENRALQDQEVGVDTKPIHQGYNPIYGTSHFSKYAAYTITNNRMRNTLLSTTSLYNMFRKMHNLQWRTAKGWTNSKGVAIDLVNGKRIGYSNFGQKNEAPATRIDFVKDILLKTKLFYGSGQSHRQISNLGKKYIGKRQRDYVVSGNSIIFKYRDKEVYKIEFKENSDKATLYKIGEKGQKGILQYKVEGNTYTLYSKESMYQFTLNGDSGITNIYALKGEEDNFNLVDNTKEFVYFTSETVVNQNGEPITTSDKGEPFDPNLQVIQIFDNKDKVYKCTFNKGDLILDNGNKFDLVNLVDNFGFQDGKLHSINSLFDLHTALGGIFCETYNNGLLVPSEYNLECIVNYMNIVSGQSKQLRDSILITQAEYYQPLKEMYIGYDTNVSAFKNGAANINPVTSWDDDTPLTFIEVDTYTLGAQGDFDHKADEAMMSTPTQVMTALAQGGHLYEYSDQIYRAVGAAAMNAMKIELQVFNKYLKNKKANYGLLYDLIGRLCIENMGSNSTSLDLSEQILRNIEQEFNLNISNHDKDTFKIPFSDPSLFGHFIPTIMNIINKKAIRVKNPGLGMVMVPSFGRYQIWTINGKKYTNADLMQLVSDSNTTSVDELKQQIIQKLEEEQAKVPFISKDTLYYDLGSIINVKNSYVLNDQQYESNTTINIDSLDAWVAFDDNNWLFFSKYKNLFTPDDIKDTNSLVVRLSQLDEATRARILQDKEDSIFMYFEGVKTYQENCTQGRDLAPTRIALQFSRRNEDGTETPYQKAIYQVPVLKEAIKTGNVLSNLEINTILDNIKRQKRYQSGTAADGTPIYTEVLGYKYYKPEAIVSNVWTKEFNIPYYKSLLEAEQNIFNIENITNPIELEFSTVNFLSMSGQHVRVTLSKPNKGSNNTTVRYTSNPFNKLRTEKNNDSSFRVYYTSGDLDDEILVGFIIKRDDLDINTYRKQKGEFQIKDGEVYEYIQFINQYTATYKHKISEKLYHIDEKAIDRIIALSKDGRLNKKSIVKKAISQLYNLDHYVGITTSGNIESENIISALQGLTSEYPTLSYIEDYLKAKTDEDKKVIFGNYLNELEKRVKVSFQKTKEVISSRVPAQSLQSFMAMEVVGYSQMDTNVAYVTAQQTFLQGSDYDIDKAYMMTYFFDKTGQFIFWSPLCSLESVEQMEASTKIPLPEDIYIGELDKDNVVKISGVTYEQPLTVESDAKAISNTTELLPLLDKLVDTYKSLDSKEQKLKKNKDQNLEEKLKQDILKEKVSILEQYAIILEKMHQLYSRVDYNKVQRVLYLKFDDEHNPSKYNKIFQNIRNHQKYRIPKSIEEQALQNSYTSKMILIATDLNNLNSAHTAITMKDAKNTTKLSSISNDRRNLYNPTDVLHMQHENLAGKVVISVAANGEKGFFTLYQYYMMMYNALRRDPNNKELRKFLEFSKTFNNIEGRWEARFGKLDAVHARRVKQIANLNHRLIESLKNPDGSQVLDDETIQFEVDQMISQLLSAATDNAKELILFKINADINFAKMYFYLLTLGFNLNDIAAFMTSGAANVIVKLSQSNMFNFEAQNNNATKVINILQTGGMAKQLQSFLGDRLSRQFFARFKRLFGDRDYKEFLSALLYGEDTGVKSITDIRTLINKVLAHGYEVDGEYVEGLTLSTEQKQQVERFAIYFDKMKYTIQTTINEDYKGNKQDFLNEVEEFKNVLGGADELSGLVQVFLSSNQGLPSTIDKLLYSLDKIEDLISDREEQMFIIEDGVRKTFNSLSQSEREEKAKQLFESIGNEITDEEYFKQVMEKVKEYKIMGNFNIDKWLFDENYRKVVTQYYNLLKHTFNIFHVIDVHPSYSVNLQQLLPLGFGMVSESNYKFKAVRQLRSMWRKLNNGFFDSTKLSKVVKVANKIMLRRFFEDFVIQVPIDPEWTVLEGYQEKRQSGKQTLVMNNNDSYSSFKYVMESYIIPQLKSGTSTIIESNQIVKSNAFIRSLIPFTERGLDFYKLDIDLDSPSNYSSIKYNDIVKGFKQLADIKVEGFMDAKGNQYTLQDLFILYNFIVHQNQYGFSTITSLFKDTISSRNMRSLLNKYEQYIGEIDKRSNQDDYKFEQYKEDLAWEMAPTTNAYFEKFHDEHYLKVSDNGIMQLKVHTSSEYDAENADRSVQKSKNRTGNSYEVVPVTDMYGLDKLDRAKVLINFAQYGVMASIGRDTSQLLATKLRSRESDLVQSALLDLIQQGRLVILVNC